MGKIGTSWYKDWYKKINRKEEDVPKKIINKPLTWFYCDHCKEKMGIHEIIVTYKVEHNDDTTDYSDFKILHRGDCDRQTNFIDGRKRNWCEPRPAHNPWGIPHLIGLLEDASNLNPNYKKTNFRFLDASIYEVLRRLTVPYYEQARQYKKAYGEEVGFDPITEYPYREEILKEIIEWGLKNE